jgi:hypothetical protein
MKALLLLFVIFSVGFLAFKEFRSDPKGSDQSLRAKIPVDTTVANAAENVSSQQMNHQVIAYYFHTTYRCPTCLKIEEYTRQAIMGAFPEEIKSGSLLWKSVNVEENGNDHFIKEYQLFSKSVIVVDMRDGKQVQWKNLKDIWKLAGSKEAFSRYIQGEVRQYLGKS